MEIYIIGTSHIAKESAERVQQAIYKIKPDVIALELDRSRFANLFKPSKPSILAALKAGFGGLFGFIGARIQRALGQKVGLFPGEEMRAAIRAAKNVGSKIALIDKPIELTLSELSKIPFLEKLKLLLYMTSSARIKFDLNKVPSKNFIKKFLTEFKKEFPNFYRVLVESRNVWMANKIKALSAERILVVVGAGHVDGLVAQLRKDFLKAGDNHIVWLIS